MVGLGFDELYRQTVMENSLATGTQASSSHWFYERDKSDQPNIFLSHFRMHPKEIQKTLTSENTC